MKISSYIQENNGGGTYESTSRTKWFKLPLPFYPIVVFSLNFITFVSLAFIPDQRIALYCGIPFMIFCYILYQLKYKKVVTFEQQINLKKEVN